MYSCNLIGHLRYNNKSCPNYSGYFGNIPKTVRNLKKTYDKFENDRVINDSSIVNRSIFDRPIDDHPLANRRMVDSPLVDSPLCDRPVVDKVRHFDIRLLKVNFNIISF